MAPKKAGEPAAEGTRKSSRVTSKPAETTATPSAAAKAKAAPKRKAEEDSESKDDEPKKKTAPASKGKAASSATTSQLKVGDALPNETLVDEEGKDIVISDLKKCVIFSYPKANTSGCTKQGQCYRDAYSAWQELGFEVFGLSNDNPTPLKTWKTKQNFQYRLISDPKRVLIKALTGSDTQTKRSHFVVDSEGKLAQISVSVKPAESSDSALEFAKTL